MSGSTWADFCQRLATLDGRLPESSTSDPDVVECLLSTLVQGILMTSTNEREPRWVPWNNLLIRNAANNPDADYRYCPVGPDGVYRVSGPRGTSRYAEILVCAGIAPLLEGDDGSFKGQVLACADLGPADPSTNVDIVFSRVRPLEESGAWVPLPADADHLLLRQMAYDWHVERDARLTVERLDRPMQETPVAVDRLDQLANYVPRYIAVWDEVVAGLRARGVVNRLESKTLPARPGTLAQGYGQGLFAFERGEALIVELDGIADARYWGVHLADEAFVPLDWAVRQCSLNGGDIAVDNDGVVRVVVAGADPGVANWLDTSGRRSGAVVARVIGGEGVELQSRCRVAPLDRLRRELPPETVMVSSPERRRAMGRRRASAEARL